MTGAIALKGLQQERKFTKRSRDDVTNNEFVIVVWRETGSSSTLNKISIHTVRLHVDEWMISEDSHP